jgi:murein DD-endopeptidase MepM/ murein hydrolase activator NlpD
VTSRFDPDDDLSPEHDPVVCMPKRMYQPPAREEPAGPGPRTVALVALGGALIGATLGAIGLGIAYATWTLPPRPPAEVALARRPRRPAPRSNPGVPPTSFSLETDAGARTEPPGPRYDTTQQRLGQGRPLTVALRALGLPARDVVPVVNALRRFVNMRALRPDDRVAVLRDPTTHGLARVEFRRSTTEVWAAVREGALWRGERVEVTLSTVRVIAGFKVERSIEASVQSAGLHPEVIARIAEVFNEVDLPPRLLAGDVVRVIADEERLNGQFFRYGRVHGIDYRGALGRRRAWWVGGNVGRGAFYDSTGMTFEHGPLRSPIPGAEISSRFNPRRMHPVLHVLKPHNGVDFVADTGTAIYASAEGVLVSASNAGPSGNLVRVQHRALGVETGYAHMSRFAPGLRPGMHIHARQLLGYVGTTGRSTGPHLHFSVRRPSGFIDPLTLCGPRRVISDALRPEFERVAAEVGAALDRIAVQGETPANDAHTPALPGSAPDAGTFSLPSLAPVDMGDASVEPEPEEPDEDPLDEGEEPQ